MGIRIYLVGRVALELDGKVVIGERELRGRQGRLVFAYLVCERTRPVPREDLAKALWSEELAPSWEGALSALMSRLRSLLSAGPLAASDVSLSSGFGQYRIRLPTDVWVDMKASGNRAKAVEAYHRLRELLADELATEPSPETEALYLKLLD